MNKTFGEFAVTIFKKNSNEIIDFFKKDISENKVFSNENEFITNLTTVLAGYCSVLETDVDEYITFEEPEFWKMKKVILSKIKLSSSNTLSTETIDRFLYVLRLVARVKERNKLSGNLKEFLDYLKEFQNQSFEISEIPA